MFYRILFLMLSLWITPSVHAQSPYYFLCGSDEDGCLPGYEQYCACIPEGIQSDQPYCLDFDNMTCSPLTQHPNCDEGMKFKNQASCLATIYQSEPYPPCTKVTQSFCSSHSTYMCDISGNPNSCKKGA